MARDLPIACSLPVDAAAGRLCWIEQIADEALIEAGRTAAGIELRFRADGRTEQRLLEFIEAERQCCPFLDFQLARGEELRLRIGGPEGAGPILDAFLTAAISTPS